MDLQVILKPDPGNPQELYLGSLEALGIDTRGQLEAAVCCSPRGAEGGGALAQALQL